MSDWISIKDYPSYSVNNLGQVRNDRTERVLRPKINQYGVVYVGMMKDHTQHARGLARLVAKMFLEPATDQFDTPINLDGDRYNCASDNLMWRPRWFAVRYHKQFEEGFVPVLGYDVPIKEIEKGDEYENSMEACMRFGLLEFDLGMSIMNRTYVWPTYQQFDFLDN